jgi:acyl-CoA thioesterase
VSSEAGLREVLEQDAGILDHYGMRFVSAGEGRCELEVTVLPSMINAAGLAHGGLLFALADFACAYAVRSLGAPGATINASFSFLRPAAAEMEIVAEATVISRSRRLATLSADVRDKAPGGKQLAHGTFTFMLQAG